MISDPRIDSYIAARAPFAQPILTWLRERVHAACPAADETIKWGMPFFTYKGRPLANMAAFKAHASFGFWSRGALATGREGEAMGQYGRIESMADLPDEEALEAHVRAAMALIDADATGRPEPKKKPPAAVPAELAEALAGDATASANFTGFTDGARREYCEWIGEAKRPDTRAKRAAEAVTWLREGKKRSWKHEQC